jgi:thioredoxin 1
MSKFTHALKDGDFESKVTKSKGLVMVDFWAEWCGPCRTLAPVVEDLAKVHEGSIQVYKMDVDSNPQSPTRFHIRSIPTVMLFKGGVVVDQIVGNQPREVFENAIKKNL